MKIDHFLFVGFLELALVAGVYAQPADTDPIASPAPAVPTNASLTLSNVTGDLRVLDVNGLVLATNFVYLPRIKLCNLSTQELQALLENRTAYQALTAFGEIYHRNAQSAALERQLDRVWSQGKSLTEKIQTRLEILAAMRAYNYEVAALPASMALASRDDLYTDAVNQRWALKADSTVNAAARVENAEEWRAYGGEAARAAVHDARTDYLESVERLARADNKLLVAESQSATAHQMVTGHLSRCVLLSTQLAKYGINVASAPPFSTIPALSLRTAVDADRAVN